MTLDITTLSSTVERVSRLYHKLCRNADCYYASFIILSVVKLSVNMLSIVTLIVTRLHVIVLSVVKLSVIIPTSVIMLICYIE